MHEMKVVNLKISFSDAIITSNKPAIIVVADEDNSTLYCSPIIQDMDFKYNYFGDTSVTIHISASKLEDGRGYMKYILTSENDEILIPDEEHTY